MVVRTLKPVLLRAWTAFVQAVYFIETFSISVLPGISTIHAETLVKQRYQKTNKSISFSIFFIMFF